MVELRRISRFKVFRVWKSIQRTAVFYLVEYVIEKKQRCSKKTESSENITRLENEVEMNLHVSSRVKKRLATWNHTFSPLACRGPNSTPFCSKYENSSTFLCAREGVQYTRRHNKNMSCLCKRGSRNWSKRKKSQTHSFRSKLKINSPHEQFQYKIEVFNMHTCAIANRKVNSCAERRRYPTNEEEYFLHELIASIWSQKVGTVHSDVDDVRMHFCTISHRLKRTCTYRSGRAFRCWVGIFHQFKILGRRRFKPPARTTLPATRIISRTRLIHINRLPQNFRIEYVNARSSSNNTWTNLALFIC